MGFTDELAYRQRYYGGQFRGVLPQYARGEYDSSPMVLVHRKRVPVSHFKLQNLEGEVNEKDGI
jgi:hypothetical protein